MVKKLTSALRQHGYKLTRQRRAILKVISTSCSHLTPAKIYEQAAREDSSIGLVTVYRTIDILASLGFICKIHTDGSSQSFLVRKPEAHQHHHHLVCSSCGNVVDFTDCNLDELQRDLSRKTGFDIESHFLEFHGRCPDCSKGRGAK